VSGLKQIVGLRADVKLGRRFGDPWPNDETTRDLCGFIEEIVREVNDVLEVRPVGGGPIPKELRAQIAVSVCDRVAMWAHHFEENS
jgi:hypothetical protein